MPNLATIIEDVSATKIVCIEVTSKELATGDIHHHYISNLDGYVSNGSDIPAHTPFDAVIAESPKFERGMSIPIGFGVDKSFQSVGHIVASNPAGNLDYLALGHSFDSLPVKIYFGVQSSHFSDFILIQEAKSGSGITVDKNALRLDLRDESLELDVPIITETITGGTESDGELYPLVLGKVFNAKPKLINALNHQYQCSLPVALGGLPITITAVRDNGHDVAGFTPDTDDASFKLSTQPYGEITFDAETDISFPAELALWAMKNRTQFSHSLIDHASFAQLDAIRPFEAGYFAYNGANVRELLIKLLASSVAFLAFNRDGTAFVREFGVTITNPNATADYSIPYDYIIDNTFDINVYSRPAQSISVKYCPNWNPQPKLVEPVTNNRLDEAVAKKFAEKYSEVSDNAVLMPNSVDLVRDFYPSARRLTGKHAIETLLYNKADAESVMWGLKQFFNRTRWQIKISVQNGYGFGANVGDLVSIDYTRYGVDNQVMTIKKLSDSISENITELEAIF